MCCKFAISFDDRSVVPKVYFQGISSELSVIWVYVDSKRYVVMIRKDVAVHCGRRSQVTCRRCRAQMTPLFSSIFCSSPLS